MSTATMPQITSEYAVASRDFAAAGFEREMLATKRVIAAIPEKQKLWKPDPKSKTAEELAWHIASVEVGMLQGIADLSFISMQEGEKIGNNPPPTIAEIVKWYEDNMPKAIARIRAMTPQQLL